MATGPAIYNLQHCFDERTGQGEGDPATRTVHALFYLNILQTYFTVCIVWTYALIQFHILDTPVVL